MTELKKASITKDLGMPKSGFKPQSCSNSPPAPRRRLHYSNAGADFLFPAERWHSPAESANFSSITS
ncbi:MULTISPECIES: hypothetical protein [Rhizobium]|jgi:hypothetical protein|uniref:hypothetical protein n=1 Tax=Rhizobium TaxID=379 RepID=UPI000FEC5F50|nr:hypothetical protein [Rhizobium leguminosarum]MBY2907791.1 hypothetical protein [Rhizobium leguminosarum]MBY2922210.1 hypothetical protein [Rhizobium leguminosarum]MBY2948742.1 hypothetical protein [Rhizobium leguminosarum]MBY2965092.1 hypothetical protein [Rhizobium leguminosarum]MBY3022034.1 hypothetical protein [Rhizobium leguminosarum]